MDKKFLENSNELVINQLCARQPFGVRIWCKWYMYQANEPTVDTGRLVSVDTAKKTILVARQTQMTNFPVNRCGTTIKPYLRSLSKMTDAEEEEYDRLFPYDAVLSPMNIAKITEWYYRHHFDFTGLIDKGLALEAPDGLYDIDADECRKEMYEEAMQAVADSYMNVFHRKFRNLPELKGAELHNFKNFLNKCQQTFGLKYSAAFEKQEELFENLAYLFALWGAKNLTLTEEEAVTRKKFSRSEKKHRNPERIYPEGTKVVKFSGKPFKSGEYVNTVKDVIEHPDKIDKDTGKGVPAYTFVEDDSIVECARCTYAETIPVKL